MPRDLSLALVALAAVIALAVVATVEPPDSTARASRSGATTRPASG